MDSNEGHGDVESDRHVRIVDVYFQLQWRGTVMPRNQPSALARSLFLNVDVVDEDHEVSGLSNIERYPYAGNSTVDGTLIATIGMQYRQDGDYDAHFVLFRNIDAIHQLTHFVETMIDDSTLAEIIRPKISFSRPDVEGYFSMIK
jgi:hypothetical protein